MFLQVSEPAGFPGSWGGAWPKEHFRKGTTFSRTDFHKFRGSSGENRGVQGEVPGGSGEVCTQLVLRKLSFWNAKKTQTQSQNPQKILSTGNLGEKAASVHEMGVPEPLAKALG